METANFLAQLWGFSLIVICLSLLITPNRAKSLFRFMEQEAMEFLHGTGHFIIGLAMVLNYNVWDKSWKTIITVLGWLLIVSGASFLFAPQMAGKMVAKFKNSNWTPLIFVVGVLLGCLLIYFSFTA